MQGNYSESNLAGKYVKKSNGKAWGAGGSRGQITKGHEHQSKKFVLYLIDNGEPLRVFEQQSDMIRAVL